MVCDAGVAFMASLDRQAHGHYFQRKRIRTEVIMLKNLHYDMMEQMAELSQSLSRMDTYIRDSQG